jgi:hypothetical protein
VALPIFLYTSWVLYDRSMCAFLVANEIVLMFVAYGNSKPKRLGRPSTEEKEKE